MKIGILTVHRAINVGAVLQCYALQEVLKSLGHDVWVINYQQSEVESSNRPHYSFSKLLSLLFHGHLRSVYNYHNDKKNQIKKNNNFNKFLTEYLHCTSICNIDSIPSDFDVYVIGSDQVWNWNIFKHQDPIFWGKFYRKDNARIISYAASTSIDSLNKTEKEFIEKSLRQFSLISVRERTVAEYMNNSYTLTHKVESHIDPTLIAPMSIWDSFKSEFVPDEPYIFVYAARPYKLNPKLVKQRAEELANKIGCKVVYMSYLLYAPVDYVALIRNASAVITSSFHGVAFSLIFNRPLYALAYGDEQDYRYMDLLQSLDAVDRIFPIQNEIKVTEQEYSHINKIIKNKTRESLEYIKIVISND
ncbi:MAG: polysaccharide pyruvyl transferase family protein [Bacteroidaceae bacterium]|nr:polysaccharide pyruvyl transferase family protein [Bacteroidaceae bacterium]